MGVCRDSHGIQSGEQQRGPNFTRGAGFRCPAPHVAEVRAENQGDGKVDAELRSVQRSAQRT